RRKSGALDQRLDHGRGQVGHRDVTEHPAKAANGRAQRLADQRLSHSRSAYPADLAGGFTRARGNRPPDSPPTPSDRRQPIPPRNLRQQIPALTLTPRQVLTSDACRRWVSWEENTFRVGPPPRPLPFVA